MSVMPEKFQVLCLKYGVSSGIGSFLKFIFHEEARTIEIALIVWGAFWASLITTSKEGIPILTLGFLETLSPLVS